MPSSTTILQVYESVIKANGQKPTGDNLKSKLSVQGALDKSLSKALHCEHLYDGSTLKEFDSHSPTKEFEVASIWFYPMPGTPGEESALLHLTSCSVKGFSISRLDGAGATIGFTVETDIEHCAITEFLNAVRGWNGRLKIQELEVPAEEEEAQEAPDDLPKPSKKRGRGALALVPKEDSEETTTQEFQDAGVPTKRGGRSYKVPASKKGTKGGSAKKGRPKKV